MQIICIFSFFFSFNSQQQSPLIHIYTSILSPSWHSYICTVIVERIKNGKKNPNYVVKLECDYLLHSVTGQYTTIYMYIRRHGNRIISYAREKNANAKFPFACVEEETVNDHGEQRLKLSTDPRQTTNGQNNRYKTLSFIVTRQF